MKLQFSIIFIRFCTIVIGFSLMSSLSAQRKIYEEDGSWNGLYNLNPDSLGDPWISGGLGPMSEEERAAYERLPLFTISEELRNRQLPATCDHSTEEAFRPIFTQIGGSCGQASGMAYHFTYERNALLGLSGKDQKNQCAYGFTWNFLNDATGKGSWPSAGYEIAQAMGCVHTSDFQGKDNGGSQTAWLDGYDGYYNANDCHVIEMVKFQPQDITALKNWFYDKGTGTGKNGGMVTFASNTSYPTQTIASGPFKGQKVITSLTDGSAHAQTFSGYSDEVGYDLNGDGRITNDLDINRDGSVDLSDQEKGAVQLVNSYGESWQNKGKCWVLFSGMKCNTIIGIKVAKFTPRLMIKAKLTSKTRNSLVVKTGYAKEQDASAPTETKGYGKAFNKSGGAKPMSGGTAETITVGLDCTPFLSKLTEGKGKLFLQITGTGVVNEMSVMDYTASSTPKEIKCDQSNVTITGTLNLGVPISFGPTAIAASKQQIGAKAPLFTVNRVGDQYRIQVADYVPYLISVSDIKGRIVESFQTSGFTKEYVVCKNLATGTYLIKVNSGNEYNSHRIEIVR